MPELKFNQSKGSKKWFKYVMVAVGFIILGWFVFTINPREMSETLRNIGFKRLLIIFLSAIAIIIINLLLKAYRWKMLVEKVADQKTSLWFSFNSILAGVAASSFIPGRVEVAKPFLLKAEYDVPISKSFSALIIERVLDLLTLLLIPAIALLLFPQQSFIRIEFLALIIIFLLAFASLLILFPKLFLSMISGILRILFLPLSLRIKIQSFAEQLILGFAIFKSKRTILSLFLISLIANGSEIIRFFIIAHLLNIDLSFGLASLIFTSSLLIGVLSAIPGGMGATELSAVALFSYLLPATSSVLMKSTILIDRIVSFYLLVIAGAILLLFYKKAFKSQTF